MYIILGNGMLGGYLYKYFTEMNESVMLSRRDFDASTIKTMDLLSVLEKFPRESIVVNCIAVLKGTDQLNVNGVFPHILSIACKMLDFKLIHISTNGVFDGKTGEYREDSPLTADRQGRDTYGVTKSLGEPIDAITIRTSIIGSTGGLIKWAREQKGDIKGYINHLWNGVTCIELAKTIEKICKNGVPTSGRPAIGGVPNKVLHIYSPEIISKYALLCLAKKYYGFPGTSLGNDKLDINIEKCEAENADNKTLASSESKVWCNKDIETQIQELIKFDQMG